MPYDEKLDERITAAIADWGTTHKKMFGGTCHLFNGNMMFGVYRQYLIPRLGEKCAGKALGRPYVKAFDVTGRPMKGSVMVDSSVLIQSDLVKWLNRARVVCCRCHPGRATTASDYSSFGRSAAIYSFVKIAFSSPCHQRSARPTITCRMPEPSALKTSVSKGLFRLSTVRSSSSDC
jgi:hypothetical protein